MPSYIVAAGAKRGGHGCVPRRWQWTRRQVLAYFLPFLAFEPFSLEIFGWEASKVVGIQSQGPLSPCMKWPHFFGELWIRLRNIPDQPLTDGPRPGQAATPRQAHRLPTTEYTCRLDSCPSTSQPHAPQPSKHQRPSFPLLYFLFPIFHRHRQPHPRASLPRVKWPP